MRSLGATITEEPYRVMIMDFMNMVLGRADGDSNTPGSSAHFWDVELKQSIVKDFMVIIFNSVFSLSLKAITNIKESGWREQLSQTTITIGMASVQIHRPYSGLCYSKPKRSMPYLGALRSSAVLKSLRELKESYREKGLLLNW